MIVKDASINKLIDKLKADINSPNFQYVDHWEADLYAIGFINKKIGGKLVYVSTYLKEPNVYYLELELGKLETVCKEENLGYDDLLSHIQDFLAVK